MVADLRLGTEQVVSKMLREFEVRVTPRRLQSTQKVELHQLFIGILVTMVDSKYRSCELVSRWNAHALVYITRSRRADLFEQRQQRWVVFYTTVMKIGQPLSLADPAKAKHLLDKT